MNDPPSPKNPPPAKNPIPPVISAIQKSINPGFNIYTYLLFFFHTLVSPAHTPLVTSTYVVTTKLPIL